MQKKTSSSVCVVVSFSFWTFWHLASIVLPPCQLLRQWILCAWWWQRRITVWDSFNRGPHWFQSTPWINRSIRPSTNRIDSVLSVLFYHQNHFCATKLLNQSQLLLLCSNQLETPTSSSSSILSPSFFQSEMDWTCGEQSVSIIAIKRHSDSNANLGCFLLHVHLHLHLAIACSKHLDHCVIHLLNKLHYDGAAIAGWTTVQRTC